MAMSFWKKEKKGLERQQSQIPYFPYKGDRNPVPRQYKYVLYLAIVHALKYLTYY